MIKMVKSTAGDSYDNFSSANGANNNQGGIPQETRQVLGQESIDNFWPVTQYQKKQFYRLINAIDDIYEIKSTLCFYVTLLADIEMNQTILVR